MNEQLANQVQAVDTVVEDIPAFLARQEKADKAKDITYVQTAEDIGEEDTDVI